VTPHTKKSPSYFTWNDRLFESKVEYVDHGGELTAVVAYCMTPKEGEFNWWNLQIPPGEQLEWVTIH
jgi:hypothetical protein